MGKTYSDFSQLSKGMFKKSNPVVEIKPIPKKSSGGDDALAYFGLNAPQSMNEDRTSLIGREFVHFKGGHYRLEGFAKDSETLEEMVVYRALYGEGGLWVRPAKMFFGTIERDGKTMKRFELTWESL